MGGLVLLSLVLVTLSFRDSDDGPVASAQEGAAAVLRPFQVAADRLAEPFRDAYAWVDGLYDARSDAEELRKENDDTQATGRPDAGSPPARTSVSVTSSPSATGHASPTAIGGSRPGSSRVPPVPTPSRS